MCATRDTFMVVSDTSEVGFVSEPGHCTEQVVDVADADVALHTFTFFRRTVRAKGYNDVVVAAMSPQHRAKSEKRIDTPEIALDATNLNRC